jgi:hypothetical protein
MTRKISTEGSNVKVIFEQAVILILSRMMFEINTILGVEI